MEFLIWSILLWTGPSEDSLLYVVDSFDDELYIGSFIIQNAKVSDLSVFDSSSALSIGELSIKYSSTSSYISSLNGIQNLVCLDSFICFNCSDLTSVSSLGSFTCLKSFEMYSTGLVCLDGLSASAGLTDVVAYDNKIGDISAISELTNLQTLTLYGNSISDISALGKLTNLTSLSLYSNSISDLSVFNTLISNCTDNKIKFTSLDLSNNLLENTSIYGTNNITVLKNLNTAGLTNLNISGNKFTDTSGISGLSWTSYTE